MSSPAETLVWESLYDWFKSQKECGNRLALMSGTDDPQTSTINIDYVFVSYPTGTTHSARYQLDRDRPILRSMAHLDFQASRFEREIADLFGVTLEDHPLPKPLVRHGHWPDSSWPMRRDFVKSDYPFTSEGGFPFIEVGGDSVYEIPVGPVHAGMIEPGHFRISAVGESILKMKARLWFVHRGIEKLMENRSFADCIRLAELVSGDTSFGHSLALTTAIEDALGVTPDGGDRRPRALLSELERAYNFLGDFGALANDVGMSIVNSHALSLREAFLRANFAVTGHRLLRGALEVGRTNLSGLPDTTELKASAVEFEELTRILLGNSTARDRFTNVGILSNRDATNIGCLGYVGAASAVTGDLRMAQYPSDHLPETKILETGDTLARLCMRIHGFRDAVRLIDTISRSLTDEPYQPQSPSEVGYGSGRSVGIGLAEAWRGRIAHRVEIDGDQITRAKLVDPSFSNWPALSVALKGVMVADFPLVNKSFNQSYAGNDL